MVSSSQTTPTVEVSVQHMFTNMTYDYEYIGPFNRIVVTPITGNFTFSIGSWSLLSQV